MPPSRGLNTESRNLTVEEGYLEGAYLGLAIASKNRFGELGVTRTRDAFHAHQLQIYI